MKKALILLCVTLGILLQHASAQSKLEVGVYGDIMYVDKYSKGGFVGTGSSYKIASPLLSIGGYASIYAHKAFGLQIGIQYVNSSNNTVIKQLSIAPFTKATYTYHYSAIKIPIGFTGDVGPFIYYALGVNFHLDMSTENGKTVENMLVNGMGCFGELGVQSSFLKDIFKIRLGLHGANENMLSFGNKAYNIFDIGLRVRLGLRL